MPVMHTFASKNIKLLLLASIEKILSKIVNGIEKIISAAK
jgi:hypothetical protein